jgi:hypothetical protein
VIVYNFAAIDERLDTLDTKLAKREKKAAAGGKGGTTAQENRREDGWPEFLKIALRIAKKARQADPTRDADDSAPRRREEEVLM